MSGMLILVLQIKAAVVTILLANRIPARLITAVVVTTEAVLPESLPAPETLHLLKPPVRLPTRVVLQAPTRATIPPATRTTATHRLLAALVTRTFRRLSVSSYILPDRSKTILILHSQLSIPH